MKSFYKVSFVTCILQCLFLIKVCDAAVTYDWTGSTNNNWTTPGNWKVGGVTQTTNYPGTATSDIAQIGVTNTFTNQPTISGTVGIATLIIGTKTSSVTLTVNAALSISGDFTQKNDGSGNGVTTSITGTGSLLCANNFYVGDSTPPPAPLLGLANVTYKTILNFSLSGLTVGQNVVLTTTSSSAVVNIFQSANVNNPIFNLNSGWLSVGNAIQTVDANDVNLSGFTIVVVTYSPVSSCAQFLMNPTTGNSSIIYFNGSNPLSLDGNAGYVDFYGTAGGTSQVNYSGGGNQEVYTTSSAYNAAGTRQFANGLDRSPSVYQDLVFSGSFTKKADPGNLTIGRNFILSVLSTPVADFVTNSPIVTIGGTYTANINTTLNLGGTGTMSVAGTSSNAGTLNQTGSGNITFTGAVTNLATTGIISQTSTGTITASSGFTNAGTYTQGSGSTGGMSVTGALSNSGTITQTTGNITVSGALTNVSSTSTISQTANGAIIASGGLTNSGIFSQGSSATGGVTVTGTFNNIDSLKQTGGAITVNGALTNSGKLILGTANLAISGNYTNSGTYSQSTGTTLFNGSSAEILQDASTAGTNFNSVSFSGSGAKTMSSGAFSVASTSILTMIGGSNLAANGNLTLKSDSLGSATVAALSSGAKITGNVNVQRFFSGGSVSHRGYRLMSSPVNQGSGVYSINYLINSCILTGTNGISGGFDKTGNPTVFLFRENIAPMYTTFLNSAFRGINNILTAPIYGMDDTTYPTANIPVGNGYLFFFRGDRNAASLSTETTLGYVPVHATATATGTLNADSVTVKNWYTPSSSNLGYTNTTGNSTVHGYNLVGNPFASSIDWDKFQTSSSGSGIYGQSVLGTIYVYDETTKTYGSYISGSGGVGSQSYVSNVIASGQGFFVTATCACSKLTFYESAKTNTLPIGAKLLMSNKKIAINNQYLRLQLLGNDPSVSEQTLVRFKDGAPLIFTDDLDARYKAGSGGASLSTKSQDNVTLCINTIPLPRTESKVIKLNIYVKAGGLYTLSLRDLVAVPRLYDIWLMDSYEKDSLDMRQNKSYSFNINKSDTASFGSNRFTLVIRQNPAYAYRLIDFAANKVSHVRKVNVVWGTKYEGNYTRFTVERSVDNGATYQILGGVDAADLGTYSFVDKNPANSINLYRLKQEDINNNTSYSRIVTVEYANTNGSNLSVYPNPARGTVNLAISSQSADAGVYNIRFVNSTGLIVKEVISPQVFWQGNISNLLPGTYVVRVMNNKTQSFVGESKLIKL